MNVQRRRPGMKLLLLGVVLLPVIIVFQSADRDLGIVRVRYVTIVVRDYDEALHWYTDVLGLEKTEEGTFGAPVAKSSAVQTPGDKRWIVVAPRAAKTWVSFWKLPSLSRRTTQFVTMKPELAQKRDGCSKSKIAESSMIGRRNAVLSSLRLPSINHGV
jgi:hypothetical protein